MPTLQLICAVSASGVAETKAALEGMQTAGDNASTGLKGLLANTLSMAAGQFVFQAVGQAVGFLKDQIGSTISLAMQQQQIMAQTNAVLSSTHDISGMTSQGIMGIADALSQVTTYAAPTTEQAEDLLLTFTNIGKTVFPQATQATLNMATSMHEDLSSAALQVGKALGEPITGMAALSREGVTFSASQKATITSMVNTGNVAGAQKIILQELGTEFGNSAQKAGGTFAGSLAILGNKFDDIKEKIGAALLPVLGQLLSSVSANLMPAFDRFSGWFIGTGLPALQRFGGFIEGTVVPDFQKVMGAIGNIVSVGANLVSFFQHSQVASTALLIPLGMLSAVLVNMAVGAIVGFIASLPELIGGFALWAAGAWTAAAGTIAATWPVLAIGAAIGLLIGGIILLVSHWTQVSAFLSGVWAATIEGVKSGLSALGQFFGSVFGAIGTGVGNFFSLLGTLVHNGMTAVLNFFLAPINAVVALFNWLYQHNTYFADLVNAIRAIVSAGLAWLQDQWQRWVSWITGLWSSLTGIASNAFNALKAAIMTVVLAIGEWEIAQWERLTGWISDQWNRLTGFAQNAWNSVVGVFKGVWGMISGPLNSMSSNIGNFFSNLAGTMLQAGENLIKMLIQGIQNMAGQAGQAAQNIASSIAGFLGFHSPAKEGPGADADKWMVNLGTMLQETLNAQVGKVSAGAFNVSAAISGPLSPSLNPMLSPATARSFTGGSVSGQPQNIQVDVYLDGSRTAQKLMGPIVQQIRAATGVHF